MRGDIVSMGICGLSRPLKFLISTKMIPGLQWMNTWKRFQMSRMLALVEMSFHAGLLLACSILNLQKQNTHTLFVGWTFATFQAATILPSPLWLYSEFTRPSLPYDLRLSLFMFCVTPSPSPLVWNAWCPARVLLFKCFIST